MFREIFFIAVLCFIFYGEPDVWDLLHDRVMHELRCK